MKYFTSVALFCALISNVIYLDAQEWESFSLLPNGFQSHHSYAFGLDGKGYLATGATPTGFTDAFFSYDPDLDEWTQLSDFPGDARGFAIGDDWDGKAYMGFGVNPDGVYLNDLWVFDPQTMEWTELSSCPCAGRAHPALIANKGKVYMGLGNDPNGNMNDWWVYDIATDQWTQGANFPDDRRHHPFQFGVGDYAYVGFGHGPSIYDEWYRYDVETDSWAQMSNIPAEGRVAGTQFAYNGKGYVLSGDGDDHGRMPTGEFWEYSPEDDQWTQLPPHPGFSRWAPSSFVLDHTVYFMNGIIRDPYYYATANYKYSFIQADIVEETGILCAGDSTGALSLDVFGVDPGSYDLIWSTGDTTAILNNLPAGTYDVTVDLGSSSLTSTYVLSEPDSLQSDRNIQQPTCHAELNGSIELIVSGGTSPYLINWSNGSSGSVLTDLLGGDYTYTITDINGCSSEGEVNLIDPPFLLIEVLNIEASSGNDGSISFTVQGGIGEIISYLYTVDAPDIALDSITGNGVFSELAPGEYFLEVVDENGCKMQMPDLEVESVSNTFESLATVSKPKIYPNPVSEILFFEFKGEAQLGIKIYNLLGNEILETQANNQIDVSNLKSGAYIIEFRTGHGVELGSQYMLKE